MYHINKEITRNGENLTLKNTAKHYFKKFDILGNSKQETREGYNLLPIETINTTINDVTVINNGDGSLTLNGTAKAYTAITLFSGKQINLSADTYLVSKKEISGTYTTSSQFLELQDSENQRVMMFGGIVGNVSLSQEKVVAKGYIAFAVDTVFNNYRFALSLVNSKNVNKPYEQYGASPSIEYEAPIESVGDNINLFNKDDVEIGYLDKTGKILNNSTDVTSQYIEVQPNTNYIKTTGNGIACYDKNKVFISYAYSTTILTPENCAYIRITVLNENIDAEKFEKGSKATLYSPYGQGSIEIYNGNKNFLNLENMTTQTKNGVTLTKNNDGSYTLNGTSTAPTEIKIPINLLLKKGTYTHSTHNEYKGGLFISFNNLNYTMIGENFMASKTFTIEENTKYTTYYIWISSGVTFNNYVVYPMLEYGSSVREYIPHQSQTKALYTQQPFRAIGDVRDRFVKQNGVWHEEHSIYRRIFDGTEDWSWVKANESITLYQVLLPNVGYYSGSSKELICNMFYTYSSGVLWGLPSEGVCINSHKNLQIATSDILNSVENWKAKLQELYNAGTPLYADYLLATPTLIPCTPEQVEVLEYFEKEAYSYDEVTHIYSTDEVSPYFEVTAYERISEEFKTRLKEGKITRGYLKVLATDTLPEIIINENNYLKDLKIEELRYVPEEGIIGGTVAKRVSGNFNNVDSSFDIQDREIEVYLGVELEDETTEYIRYGTYIVQRPEDDQVNDNTSFEALDYMIKFNQEYKDRITYPCTLKQLLDDIIDQAGVNSKVATFANSDFVVENNQFEQGSTLRDVLKAITQVAFNWSRIDADDNLVMDFEINEEVDEELSTDDYFGFKKTDDYGPVNVIVLRNSQVEGENVTIKDENLINSPKGYNLLPIEVVDTVINGVTVINNGDGSITLNGTASAYTSITIFANKEIKLKPDMYTVKKKEISGTYTTSSQFFELQDENNQRIMLFGGIVGNVRLSQEKTAVKGHIVFAGGTVFENYTFILSLTNSTNVEKPYQPYIPVGEVELVIADNPFAYTELKRKQLIEAGRRLFGLRYTPMAVDMLGLMYLNAKDRISVENLNGEKYSTYLFDHTIDYTGIVLDSMESKAKTKTETKYQYISSLAQGLSNVEIKVDKANKKIESIVQTQEDVSEKVAKTVARIEVVYALSDSSTIEPTDGWSTTAPEWTAGKYMWQKTITTYANGTTAETAATNISGAKGEAGQNGVGIIQTNITYQKSTSGTTVPTGTWQTTIPEVNEDGYLWTRTEFIYSDESKKYAYNVGKKGAAGIGVKSLVDQYYLSTSNTEQTGGEWTETQPEWQEKTYIWTRTKINWTDNSITYTDPVLANTLNDINSNIVVLRELSSSQIVENGKIITRIEETTKKLNNDYSTTEQVDSKIDGLEDKYETLVKRFVDIEASNKEYAIKINAIDNNGVDKIKTLMGYTFNDEGLNIDRPGADTATLVNEKGVEVSDKTGASSTPLLYAGYVEEGNDKFPNYEGQTIVATSNLIVKNFLVIGSNSRFQDYINPVLGGQGTGAYDI